MTCTQIFPFPQFHPSGERCLLAVYAQGVDAAVNEKLRRITALLNQEKRPGIEEVVPSYSSLAVFYDPVLVNFQALCDLLRTCEQNLDAAQIDASRTITIPVCYGGDFGPDLADVARHNQLSPAAVIARHCAALYRIFAIGFAPGFCYLGGLDESLHTPRLETPRTLVAAGSVGIAGSQTGIYPQDSPGGWRIIGRTPLTLFNAERAEPCPYRAGDNLRFQAVDEAAFHAILAGEQS
ncbi:MAG: 5-oxoprolinase subunit PxpB [bacterium]|nr:5-oxoprolinase subunit PxpB [bacterium]